jgi:hypothetical protein
LGATKQATDASPDRQESSWTVDSRETGGGKDILLDASPASLGDDACDTGWDDLTPGEHVSLQGPGARAISGIADDISHDGMFLWLFLDDGGGRQLFHWSDGYTTAGTRSGTKGSLDQP